MRQWTKLKLRARSLLRHRQVERELEEELQFHLRQEAEAAKRAGMGATSAEQAALRAFRAGGDVGAVREACREQRGWSWAENFIQDARRALRRLAAAPGFTLTAIAALGFGVAMAAAMFSLCDAVLLRPLPGVDASAGLVHLERVEAGQLLGDFGYPDYLDYQAQSRSFSELAATDNDTLNLALGGGVEETGGELVTANYFATLGVRAELGRTFVPRDELAGSNRVVVLSDALWRARFAADRGVVGRSLVINRVPMTVVGVAGPGYRGASLNWTTDLWVPVTMQPALQPMSDCMTSRSCGFLIIFGRLAPGIGLAGAQAEVATVAARISAALPLLQARQAEVVAGLGSWSDDRTANGHFLGLLLGATLLLVAMTCASLGGLFLARTSARQREVATQLALGASRRRVAQQFLLEAAIIAVIGAGLGVAAAGPAAAWLLRLAPTAPQNLELTLDGRVLAFVLGLAGLSAAAMALGPVLFTARGQASVARTLQQGGYGASAARHAAQRGMLAAQIGIAFVLLLGAGLAARTIEAATAGQIPAGADHTVIGVVVASNGTYTYPQAAVLFQRLLAGTRGLPGVTSATLAAHIPPSPSDRGAVYIAGTEPPPAEARARDFTAPARPDVNVVGPGYFSMFDVTLDAGRGFAAGDRGDSALVCVINQRLAEALWPHQSPLGRQIAWPNFNADQGPHDFIVVGVVADQRTESLVEAPPEQMYVAVAQVPTLRLWIAAQGSLPAAELIAGMRRQLTAIAPTLPLRNTRTLEAQVQRSVWQPLAIASLAGLFGVLAALMAVIGLFGAGAQQVEERRRELGVRLALGATPGGLVRMVVRDGLAPIGWGLAAGGVAAALAARLLTPWLYGVTPTDAAAWAGAAGLLALAAITAAWAAAARAARVPVIEALRCE